MNVNRVHMLQPFRWRNHWMMSGQLAWRALGCARVRGLVVSVGLRGESVSFRHIKFRPTFRKALKTVEMFCFYGNVGTDPLQATWGPKYKEKPFKRLKTRIPELLIRLRSVHNFRIFRFVRKDAGVDSARRLCPTRRAPLPPAVPGAAVQRTETSRGKLGRNRQIEARCCRCKNKQPRRRSVYRPSPARW